MKKLVQSPGQIYNIFFLCDSFYCHNPKISFSPFVLSMMFLYCGGTCDAGARKISQLRRGILPIPAMKNLITLVINAFMRLRLFIRKKSLVSRFESSFRIQITFHLPPRWAREMRKLTNESSLTRRVFSTFFYDLDLLRAIRSLRLAVISLHQTV